MTSAGRSPDAMALKGGRRRRQVHTRYFQCAKIRLRRLQALRGEPKQDGQGIQSRGSLLRERGERGGKTVDRHSLLRHFQSRHTACAIPRFDNTQNFLGIFQVIFSEQVACLLKVSFATVPQGPDRFMVFWR